MGPGGVFSRKRFCVSYLCGCYKNCVWQPQPRLPFIELQMIQCAVNWKCFQSLSNSISLAAEVGKPPPTEPREILKMRLSEITDTYRCSLCQSGVCLLKWYLLTLTSQILESKLLHIYFDVTEKFDGIGKITATTLLACGWKCVCHISVLLKVGHDELPLAQSFWH